MSVELLERAAQALGEALTAKVVFVGAATLPLWIDDPAAPAVRPTKDVDVVVEVTTLIAFNRFEQRLRDRGFRDDGSMLGRFSHDGSLQLDAIPADASILGFENVWQRASLSTAVPHRLPAGLQIRVLAPANLLATKLEAFAGRGRNDYLASADFEDIVALVDGRERIEDEVASADRELRAFVAGELTRHLDEPRAREAISAHLEPSGGPQRARAVLLPRLERLSRTSYEGR